MSKHTPNRTANRARQTRGSARSGLRVSVAVMVASVCLFSAAAPAGSAELVGYSGSAIRATKKKPASKKAVFTKEQLAGKYRWVKSTATLKFSNGKTQSISVPYGPNDSIVFTVKKVPGLSFADGTFASNAASFGASKGIWYLSPSGTEVTLTFDGDNDPWIIRTVDQLDSKRLTMSANDEQIRKIYLANDLNSEVEVVGGQAFDELVRIK
jgi:hypothetical protein